MRISIFAFLGFTMASLLSCTDKAQVPPNILLILVDDMGYSDIGCFGSEITTPHIDKLAKGGLRMTQFYNAARCCPSRASLLTGLYPHEAGMGHQNQDRGHPAYQGKIKDEVQTLADVLGNAGYSTYQVGKWHVGDDRDYWPDKKGFEKYFTLIEGAMNYYNRWPWVRGQDSLHLVYNGASYNTPEHFFATKAFADTASSFLSNHDSSNPFFMYLAFNAPHWPLHASQDNIDKYRGKYLTGWDSIRISRFQKMKTLGIIRQDVELSPRFHSVPDWQLLSEEEKNDWELKMALYAAVMEELDESIGSVVSTLEAIHQLENTMIVFLSDNGGCHENPVPADAPWAIHPTDGAPGSERSFPSYGPPWANVSNTPFSYFKSYLHEGGIATPLIVHYPGKVPAGDINKQTVGHIMDLMPTFMDLAEVQMSSELTISGTSLLPAFYGLGQIRDQPLFWEHQFNRAVRKGKWKLVSAYSILDSAGIHNRWELYDLSEDPTELNNLASDQAELVLEIATEYEAWAAQVGALSPEEMKLLKKIVK